MTYRVGNHQPQNVYRGDQYIGVMFTAEDAALVVSMLNRDGCTRVGLHNCAGEWRNHDRAEQVADSCTDAWQSPHSAGSRPNMCATCSEASGKVPSRVQARDEPCADPARCDIPGHRRRP